MTPPLPSESLPVYRLAVDDVIYSFRDLAKRQPRSIFDTHFLQLLREQHRNFGTRVTLNLFLQTHEGDFSLTDFPASYRREWEENSDWLRLAFHARQEFPDRAYEGPKLAAFERDYEELREQVLRFAGEESWIPPCLIHFCTIPDDSLKTMASWGVKRLAGLFHRSQRNESGWDLHYGVGEALAERVARNELAVEPESGITLSLVDLIINNCPADQIAIELAKLCDTPARASKIDLLTHEQYSWSFYPAFLPDHPERLANALRWCTEHGYQPAFHHA